MSELHRHNRHSPSHVTHSDGTMLPSQTSHMPIGCDVVTLVEGALPKAKGLGGCPLADEYDAAQKRGEVRSHGGDQVSKLGTCSFRDLGLTYKDINEARQIRDAEEERG